MRKLFTQSEITKAAKLIGISPFTRGNMWYWMKAGVFPKPYSSIKGKYSWYKRNDIILGLINVYSRLIVARKIDEKLAPSWKDMEKVMDLVAKDSPEITDELSKLSKI